MMALSRSKQMLRASLKSIVERGKSRKRKYSPTEVAQLWIKGGFDQDGFEVRHISHDVGRGVFATKSFNAEDFLLEYVGEVLDNTEATKREKRYLDQGRTRWFMYHFRHGEKNVV